MKKRRGLFKVAHFYSVCPDKKQSEREKQARMKSKKRVWRQDFVHLIQVSWSPESS